MRRIRLAIIVVTIMGVGSFAEPVRAQFGDWPAVFNPQQLLTLNLDMDPRDWVTVQHDDPYDETPQIEVPAMFWADGEIPILVSVRRKPGDALQNGTPFAKVSLKIDINDFVVGQAWHGLKKVSLENGDDQDVVSEGLAWQVERLASGTQGYGYHAGHFAWVRLLVNDVYVGVYVNLEQRDKRFLENRGLFIDGQTWLYKKGELGPPDLKVGGPQDSPTSEALCFSPFNTGSPCAPQPDLATATQQYVNVKGLLTLMVNDAFQANVDALLTNGKNFYYADFAAGLKRMYLPWDRDSSFSGGSAKQSIYPGGSAYDALLNVPAFRAEYNQVFNDLVCGPWSAESLVSFLDAVQPVLTDALAADANNQFGPDVAGRFDALRNLVTQRVAVVVNELEGFQSCPTIQVNLNEFMATNAAFLEDPDEPGEFPDWLELHNPLPNAVDIGGLYLTDDLALPTKYQIPFGVILPGDGYLVFYADNDIEQGPLHTNFKLAAAGEVVAVFDANGVTLIDAIAFGGQLTDVSFGRFPSGSGPWGFMSTPTPSATNAPHNAPPSISDVSRAPTLPTSADTVIITATVSDNVLVASVTLRYDAGGGWVGVTMLDDGASGDGSAGDGVYGAVIPAQPTDTIVNYYLVAQDDVAAQSTDPPFAPALTHTYVVDYVPPALFINEFMADNDTVIEDPDAPLEYDDWIEIYNAEPFTVDLGGMYLTDDLAFPRKFLVPGGTTIPAGGYLLYWADNQALQGPTHLNFRLGASGEEIGLYDADARGNVPIDTLTFGPQQTDVSQGRCPDASANLQFFNPGTPGTMNEPCSAELQACCLAGGACNDLDAFSCADSGGLAQGSGSSCATTTCPECVADEDCDDEIICTIDRCDMTTNMCGHTPFDSVCSDGFFCNGLEFCDPALGCVSPGNPCVNPVDCDETGDTCGPTGCIVSSPPHPERLGAQVSTKNRFLSFDAGDPGRIQAIRVKIDSVTAPQHTYLVGSTWWVQSPEARGEVASTPDPVVGRPNFRVSLLGCEPFFKDWNGVCDGGNCLGGLNDGTCQGNVCIGGPGEGSGCSNDADCPGEPCTATADCGGGIVNVYGEMVVPGASYTVSVVGEGCDLNDEGNFTDASLTMTTSVYGDVAGACTTTGCDPPDGAPVAVADALAILAKFSGAAGAIQKARADIEPSLLDFKINVTDVLQSLRGFSGLFYPFLSCRPTAVQGRLCFGGPTHLQSCVSDLDCRVPLCP